MNAPIVDDDLRRRALEEAALRARLYARDGIHGDLIEGGRAAMRALMPSGDPPKKEIVPKRLGDLTGKTIGGSVVGARVGVRERDGATMYEVPCAGCGATQLRASSALGHTLRKDGTVECPRCRAERWRGMRAEREAMFRARARAGGPVWTTAEVMSLRASVLAGLVAAFGEPVDPDDSMPVPLVIAPGYPWSVGDRTKDAWRSIERETVARMKEREREERRLEKAMLEVGKEAAKLLATINTGDTRAMLDVLSEIE